MARTRKTVADFPEVASQWHPTRNDDLTPEDVMSGSSKKYWWKCPKGPDHEWPATAKARTRRDKTGCPCCAGKRLSVTNSLAAVFPDKALQWNIEKNDSLTADQILAGTHNEYWWKCVGGADHEWRASPHSRRGCPFCARQKPSVTNSLANLFPEIASEWHLEKNGDLRPEQVVAGSNKRCWWKCPVADDHEWQATPGNRTGNNRTGCPCCSGRQVCKANSLASLFPVIASEWHEKNGDLKPEQVVAGSNRQYWWKCPVADDHEWKATPSSRTGGNKTGCPCCAGKKPSVTNSLASLFPEIADQWHPTKNDDLTPENVASGSSKKLWWR